MTSKQDQLQQDIEKIAQTLQRARKWGKVFILEVDIDEVFTFPPLYGVKGLNRAEKKDMEVDFFKFYSKWRNILIRHSALKLMQLLHELNVDITEELKCQKRKK